MAVPDTLPPAAAPDTRVRLRDRVATALVRVSKVFGNAVPPEVQAAEQAAQMAPTNPFSPGEPIGPYDGYSRTPRSQDFVTGRNITTRPRAHEHVPFHTLQGLIESYDVAQMCIWHRIDSIRSLEWSLVAADGHQGDVSDAVVLGMAALRKPDRDKPFDAWIAEWLFDILAFDAGALWRMRNRAGQVVGLRCVEGATLAPMLDYWGNTPQYPAPAYVQYAQGLPWNWLTTKDLIYQPFRKRTGSPYGRPPLESIILNANLDLRFQMYFLQRFTEGNIPAAFASAPETWSPQQIEQFQTYWDGYILGDQAAKSQVKWIPGGSRIEFTNEREFTDAFSLFMLRKTSAAYHVVPSDLGFTETVNKSSGETQDDVQHRIGDKPLAQHLSAIITSFLQDDLHLPLKHQFDFGEEQDDRLVTAQADEKYIQNAVVSPSEIRQLRFGLGEPGGRPVPRYIFSTRGGAVPLSALLAVAGEVDPESAAPMPGAPLPHKAFQPIEGVEPNPPTPSRPLAVQIYGPEAQPSPPDALRSMPPNADEPLAKDDAVLTAGIASATGITSYDLVGRHGDEGDDDAVEKEMALFRRHAKNSRRAGRKWKDFDFTAVDRVAAHRLNDAGRFAVRKAAGQIAVAGLAVLAEDTGRVLMLQRALGEDDPAAGMWEFPGGHVESGETPDESAVREWQEETGLRLPSGRWADASWISANSVYQGFVYQIPNESTIQIADGRDQVTNPDDPDGDLVEAIAWWDPEHLAGNPAVRPELLAALPDVLGALGGAAAKAANMSKAQARYRDPSDVPRRYCGNCSMFRPHGPDSEAGACTLVRGAIEPAAVCDHWETRYGEPVAKAHAADACIPLDRRYAAPKGT